MYNVLFHFQLAYFVYFLILGTIDRKTIMETTFKTQLAASRSEITFFFT